MRIVVIPDVHLKKWLFDRADELLSAGKADTAICLMDIPDDWDKETSIGEYTAAYERAASFARKYPDSLWCYGNHDISYIWGRLESGYSPYAESTVISGVNRLENIVKGENPDHMKFVIRVDNVIFAHGGLTKEYIQKIDKNLLNEDIDTVIDAINELSPDQLWDDTSPLWYRPQYEHQHMYMAEDYVHVVGHTPVERIEKVNNVISTDVFSTYRDGTQIGPSEMVIIDTVSTEYITEKVSI